MRRQNCFTNSNICMRIWDCRKGKTPPGSCHADSLKEETFLWRYRGLTLGIADFAFWVKEPKGWIIQFYIRHEIRELKEKSKIFSTRYHLLLLLVFSVIDRYIVHHLNSKLFSSSLCVCQCVTRDWRTHSLKILIGCSHKSKTGGKMWKKKQTVSSALPSWCIFITQNQACSKILTGKSKKKYSKSSVTHK